MPRSKQQIQSPPRPQRSGSKQLVENLSKDELLRRLKKIAQELSDADQGENLDDYSGTVTVLARAFIVKHADKDVRFYAACCFAHVLRIYAPEAPYHASQLWSIFDLIISQLEGLKDAKGEKGTSYERLFNLLETLALVKTLILCVQLEFTDLILKFFRIIFNSVREEHSKKVKNFMLDIMATLLAEAESVPQDLLDIILGNVVNPKKTSNRAAYELASTLIERTATCIEPHVQQFFNNALFFDKASESVLKDSLYDVLYELYKICPGVLLSVLPQLEFKLRSVDEQERLAVATLLAKMFSDEESTLAQSHRSLWHCFLGRFVDISTEVRVECTKHAKDFFLHHPELVGEISEKLVQRHRDPDERVRLEVVNTICETASENINNVSQKLFNIVTERLRDRKLHIRTDTMMSLGRLYKKMTATDVNNNDKKKVSWIPTKILHCYYNNSAEDRIHVERVFLGCLVPISLTTKERMKKLFILHQMLDEPSVKAFNHMFKSQASLRSDLNDILRLWEEHQKTNSQDARKLLTGKISAISRVLPDPGKSQEHLKSLVKMLSDEKLLSLLKICLGSEHDCSKVNKAVSEVVVKFGAKNPMFETIKVMLDRAAPLLIDMSASKELVTFVTKCVDDELFDDMVMDISSEENSETDGISASGRKALDLLLTCVSVSPTEFKFPLIFEHLLVYLKKEDVLVDYALRILTHIGHYLQEVDSTLYSHYQPALSHFFIKGKPLQVKFAARIVCKIVTNSSSIFKRILKNHAESLDYGSSSLLTTLSCMSEITLHQPKVFEPYYTAVIREFVVKEILMKDRGKKCSKSGALWCDKDELSKEVKAKIICLKIIVNWLRGMRSCDGTRVKPVVDMLDKAIKTNGDITEGGCLRRCEMSHIRLTAACGLLKLAQIAEYHEFLEMKYVVNFKSIIMDSCSQVRTKFAKKLSKGLDSLRLPLEYLALFSFYGREVSNDIKQQAKQMILRNINIRNEYLKQRKPTSSEQSPAVLPEYALPYLIYMLSHFPNKDYSEVNFLKEIKAYLWFYMESILARGDNYSFMKKLAENIKQTKDANAQENESEANRAIYVVCDIVIGIIMALLKTRIFLLKDYTADIMLPKKLYTPLGKGKVNDKSYLPEGFDISPVKRPSSIFPKLTPSKNITMTSSNSTDKKKTSADKSSSRVSEQAKGKKVQKSILSMLRKADEESDEDMSDVEKEETPAGKQPAEEDDKEAKFTRVSPRKKTSTAKENSTKKNKFPAKKTTDSSPTQAPLSKKRQLGAAAASSPSKKRPKAATSVAKVREEKPTRSSPRRNPKSAVDRNTSNLDEVNRTLEKDDYSDVLSKSPMDKRAKDSLGDVAVNGTTKSLTEVSQTDIAVPSPTQSPVKKRKIVEENNDQNPMELSSLVVKRKRKRR